MKLAALALDYDGTLTLNGTLSPRMIQALRATPSAGIRVLLVTGRQIGDLARITDLALFDAVVAENGAVVEFPSTGRHILLAQPPAPAFDDELRRRQVSFDRGECVIATAASASPAVVEAIRSFEQPLIISFNRESLMILPQGISKSTGLQRALS